MDRDKIALLIQSVTSKTHGITEQISLPWAFEIADHLIANGIGDITAENAKWDILCNKFGEIIANDKDCESGCYSEALRIINEVKQYSGEYDKLKHRAEVAEEALKLACQQLGYELHLFGVNKKIVVEPRIIEFKEQAEERLRGRV